MNNITQDQKFYRYTALDEFARFRYVEAFSEADTSAIFLENMLKAFRFKVECVQTDNGFEFTKCFSDAPSGLASSKENAIQFFIAGCNICLTNPRSVRVNFRKRY